MIGFECRVRVVRVDGVRGRRGQRATRQCAERDAEQGGNELRRSHAKDPPWIVILGKRRLRRRVAGYRMREGAIVAVVAPC